MRFENAALRASFEMPDDPDFDQIIGYDNALSQAFDAAAGNLQNDAYMGEIVKAAASVGLINAWETRSRDGVPLSNLNKQSGRVVLWAGAAIREYILALKQVDPKSLEPVSSMRGG